MSESDLSTDQGARNTFQLRGCSYSMYTVVGFYVVLFQRILLRKIPLLGDYQNQKDSDAYRCGHRHGFFPVDFVIPVYKFTNKAKRFAKHTAVRCYHCQLASICFCFRAKRQNAQQSKVVLRRSYSGTVPGNSQLFPHSQHKYMAYITIYYE